MKKENVQTQTVVENKDKASAFSKILSLVLLAVALMLAVGTILLAVLPKNYNIGLAEPTRIVIHANANEYADINKSEYTKSDDNGVYDKLMKLYNNSFKTTCINAMFQGKLFDSAVINEGYKSLSSLNGIYIEFLYDDSQELKINGQKYDADIINDTDYRSVVIEVKNSNSLTQINAYVKYRDTLSNDYSYVRFVSYAEQADLYNYITTL